MSKKNESKTSKTFSTLTLCAITTIFFMCMGCESPQNPPSKPQLPTVPSSFSPPPFVSKEPLPLLGDDQDDIGLADPVIESANPEDMSVIQFLNMQKQTQTKRIEVLKNELEETRARLDHIKSDIMIKGSTREKQFNDKMQNLEERVKESSERISTLEAALSERNHALEEKRLELENLSKTFSRTNDTLGQELEQTRTNLTQEIEQIKATLAQERAQFEQERLQANEIEKQLQNSNNIINQLQRDLDDTHARLEQEISKSREIYSTLERTQHQYEIAMNDSDRLQKEYHQHRESKQMIERLQNDLHETQDRLNDEKRRAEELDSSIVRVEEQYRRLQIDYSNLQTRLNESEEKVAELTQSQQMFTKSKDLLEGGLMSIIKDLEGQLAANMNKTREATNSQSLALEHQNTINDLQMRLANEQQVSQDYKRQLAIESERSSSLKQQLAQQVQQHQEIAMNVSEKHSANHQQEIAELKKRLVEVESYARDLEASIEQLGEDGANAMQVLQLDREIEVHKESLLAAQKELLELSEDYANLDGKYGNAQKEMVTQIQKLEKQNQILQQNLENAHQRLSQVQQNPSKEEEYKRLNATLDHVTASLEREKSKRQALEQEIATLRSKEAQASQALPNIALASNTEEELQATLQDAIAKYEAVVQENHRLQQQLEATSNWASNLQNEVAAYETTTGNTATHYQKINGAGENSPVKLKAKIAYLTTRLAQEKDKAQEAQDKLEEAQSRLRDLQNNRKG